MLELSTERVSGMSAGGIPVTKVWQYLDRFDLPDWWEPVLLQTDAKILAASNKESQKSEAAANSTKG
jgi:hypothetical protein